LFNPGRPSSGPQSFPLLAGSINYESLCPHVWNLKHPEAIRTYRVEERRDAADRKRVCRAYRRLPRKQ